MKIHLLQLLTLFLSGCVAFDIPYTPPLKGPTATITFKNNSYKDLIIKFYEDSSGHTRAQDLPLILPNTEASHDIYAERPLTFYYLLTKADKDEMTKDIVYKI